MYRSAVAVLVLACGLGSTIGVAHADESSYVTCLTLTFEHLGMGSPASVGGWIDLGRNIDQAVHQNGASPQSQVYAVENQGWDNPTAAAIVQCALSNSPI